ncbi:MAG: 30S ribosome-binding factor RbfA [Ruminococcaceae bacterium]|nr:30S ribosome-binding factor RbfA [Oscillospiraceae bacterium]
MAQYRKGRINDEMQKEIADILREVKDPRISGQFISVMAVDATADLKYAKVYYSALSGDPKTIGQGLRSCAGYIRTQLAKRLNLRMTPELTFIEDHSIAHGAHISKLLSSIEYAEESEESQDDHENA